MFSPPTAYLVTGLLKQTVPLPRGCHFILPPTFLGLFSHQQKIRPPQAEGLAGRAVALGRMHNEYYTVLPPIGVIDGPVEFGGWTFLPREMVDKPIPKEAPLQIQRLKEAGFEIQQEIVGLEPEKEKPQPRDYSQQIEAAKKFGQLVFLMVKAIATGIGLITVGLVTLFAMALDPVYIAVLVDGTWLVVWEWLE
jgi:hypothetical protein